jgi:cytoskeletal protein CcmA (bactofilin family)
MRIPFVSQAKPVARAKPVAEESVKSRLSSAMGANADIRRDLPRQTTQDSHPVDRSLAVRHVEPQYQAPVAPVVRAPEPQQQPQTYRHIEIPVVSAPEKQQEIIGDTSQEIMDRRDVTLVSAGTIFRKAEIEGNEDVVVHGRWLDGNISCRTLMVYPGGEVTGKVHAEQIKNAGTIDGEVIADIYVAYEGSHVLGSVSARSFATAPGVIIRAQITSDPIEDHKSLSDDKVADIFPQAPTQEEGFYGISQAPTGLRVINNGRKR